MIEIEKYRAVQTIAKIVLAELASSLRATDSERTIADRAVELLAAQGITETWYYNCPAFVLLGSNSCQSISGREYVPGDECGGIRTDSLHLFRDLAGRQAENPNSLAPAVGAGRIPTDH